jgi:RimJ/RimL family protein N-acetyltransferase
MVRHLPFCFSRTAIERAVPSEILTTLRLLLRPPMESDVESITGMLGEWEVARNLSSPPHPYGPEHARAHLANSQQGRADCSGYNFAICRRQDETHVGMIGIRTRGDRALEMGYWIGKPYWGAGYATEAGRRMADFAFAELGLSHLMAGWFVDNPASGKVLAKLGFIDHGEDERFSLARGETVPSHRMILDRTRWEKASS